MEQHSKIGYSAISDFEKCPYKYRLRYIDNVEMLDEYDPQNALTIGTALHRGIETDVQTAITEYYNSYPVITDAHITEAIKLETMIPKVKAVIPEGQHEVFFEYGAFKGTIDLLVPLKPDDLTDEEKDNICEHCPKFKDASLECDYCNSGQCKYGFYYGWYDIYDFKYSNNIDRYLESSQLHIYKYFAEKALNIKIRNMYFVFAEKTMIRQKKTEDLNQSRLRLKNTLQDASVQVRQVMFDKDKVIDFMQSQVNALTCTDYIKTPNRLCDFCEYQSYCENEEDLNMALPSINRVDVQKASKKKIWVYGSPFSGKTTFADKAPTPLNLNTDGNVKYVTMPRIAIKDEVTTEGRITKRKFAWEIFKEAIDDLEKGSDFETIVVDLLEDTYEYCRLYMYDQLGITHESDDSFRAWDKVRTEFLSNVKRLLSLDYNIILISHEDTSKDLTKKGGDKITAIQPNINEKVAKKISGMVDIVLRAIEDDGTYTLNFKTNEYIFGGGRLQGITTKEIPSNWNDVCRIYDEAIGKVSERNDYKVEYNENTKELTIEPVEPEKTEIETPEIQQAEEDKPVRRQRKRRKRECEIPY